MGTSGWEAVWSGALGTVPGALISAVSAAVVAVFVLRRSNEAQVRLAGEAVEKQRERDQAAAEEQGQRFRSELGASERRHKEALKAQKDAALLSITAQKAEARRGREFQAVAEIAAICAEMSQVRSLNALHVRRRELDIAFLKLTLELQDIKVDLVVRRWPKHLFELAERCIVSPTREEEEERDWAFRQIEALCSQWYNFRGFQNLSEELRPVLDYQAYLKRSDGH